MARSRLCGESANVRSTDSCPDVARHDVAAPPRITERQRLLVAPILRVELKRVKDRKLALQEERTLAMTRFQKEAHQKLLGLFRDKAEAIRVTLELLIDVSA